MRVRTNVVLAKPFQAPRIRVKVDRGRQLTIPYPHDVSDPHEYAIRMLLGDNVTIVHDHETPSGHVYNVWHVI